MFNNGIKKSSADRFIPRRAGQNLEVSNYLLSTPTKPLSSQNSTDDNPRYVNYAYTNYKRKIYKESLWSTIVPSQLKVLNFSERKPAEVNPKKMEVCNFDWPVKPRKAPHIQSPLTIIDMPDLDPYICFHDTDWGSGGYLISVYQKEVYVWCPKTDVAYMLTKTGKKVEHCVKWNRRGDRFAMAMAGGTIAIFNMLYKKITKTAKCKCASCAVTCIDWSMDDQYVLAGCSKGTLCVWTAQLRLEKALVCAHLGTMVTIVFSPNNNYFVTTSLDEIARVWRWPLREYFQISLFTTARAVAFHPWKESLLAIGDTEGCLSLYNINAVSSVTHRYIKEVSYEAVTFNEVSGEMVVSCWRPDKDHEDKGENTIFVFKDMDTIVDGMQWHTGKVPYLLWGNNHRQLATAGADENLCLWDFLRPSKGGPSPVRRRSLLDSCIR